MPAIRSDIKTRKRAPTGEVPGILANAVRRHVSVMVYAESAVGPQGVPGAIVEADPSSLIVMLSHTLSRTFSQAMSEFSVVLWVDGVQYAFDTHGTIERTAGAATLRLTRPTEIDIVERRRARRQRLRETSRVQLLRTDPESAEPVSAVMMNVSPHGLACRMDLAVAKQLSVGTALTSTFALNADDKTFSLPGRIVNITQGGTPGQAIIGIEFTGDEISHAQQEALSAALARGMEV